MTNLEKFIEIMNTTFNAGFTPENMKLRCSPCGILKKAVYACQDYECEKCKEWWQKEYSDIAKLIEADDKPLPVKRCKIDGVEQNAKDWTVKQWFAKINEELDELKVAVIRWDDDDADIAIMDEAADTITVITSMLDAMGFDENQRNEAQRRVNEKNRKRGRL